MTSGLQPGSLTIVGARPAVGKSAFALGIAAHVAIELRRPVLFVSLEMPHDELAGPARVAPRQGGLHPAAVGDPVGAGLGTDRAQRTKRLAGAPLVLDDDSSATVGAIRARARRFRARYKDLALVVVDYLQLLGRRAAPASRTASWSSTRTPGCSSCWPATWTCRFSRRRR